MLSILSYTFFQYALLGALLSSLLCACVGSYVVTRRLVIAGGGMAHASLGGVGMGAFFGFSPLLGAASSADWASTGSVVTATCVPTVPSPWFGRLA